MYRIMLADDEGIVIESLKFMIEKEFGDLCEIKFAKTGRSVIELAESFRPDIAIMDIQMPGINGIDAMKEIKKVNSNIIFVVMTAYDKFDYAKEAINLGVLDYLNKPARKDVVIGVLRRAMDMIDSDRKKRSEDLLIKEKMETVVPIIENGLIQNLLSREHFEDDINNYKNLLGIEENYGYMAVIIAGDEQVGNHMTGAVAAGIRMQNVYQEIRMLVEEYIPGIVGYVMANKIPILVPRNSSSMEYAERTDLIDRSRSLVRKLSERMDCSFRVGLGSVKPLGDMSDSYNEALSILIETTGRVGHADDMPIGCKYEEDYPIDVENRLFEILETGDAQRTAAVANDFFDWMEESQKDHMEDVRLKVLEFVLWAEHLTYISANKTYHFRARTNYISNIMAMNTFDELREWFVKKFAENALYISDRKENQSESAVEKAKKYMEENFAKDISLEDVSMKVDISSYYFSKLFKEETGRNFIEYLTELRMEEAKKLLKETDMSMKEICSMVGYSDPNYFSRNFKKYTGVTPTEARERL
ncbi:MAG: helix-turn-helix domain-containing protein [Lachnospiraceae bacterium]|nr:helix-turn-helix domain-containing protein [Lachnospiraceae bacterium]